MNHELNAFCERLGANVRACTVLKLIDDCGSGRFSESMRKSADRVLTQELTILVVHRLLGQLPS